MIITPRVWIKHITGWVNDHYGTAKSIGGPSMTTQEIRVDVTAALPQTPRVVLSYLRHVTANRLHVVLGQLEMGMSCKTAAGVMASMVNADKAARALMTEVDELLKEAGL